MTAPLILGLDISKSQTASCHGRTGEVPTFESVRCGEYLDDDALAKLGHWLINWLNEHKPDAVYYEAAIQRGVYEAPILKDLVAVVRFVCRSKKIPAKPVNVQTARKNFLGSGFPDHPKQSAMAMCKALGWAPANLDEADAGTIFYHGATLSAPRSCTLVTPMLQHKVKSEVEARLGPKKPKRARA